MLNTTYTGPVEALGSGRNTSSWMGRRSFIKIGPQRIRNVMLSDYLDSILEAAVDDESEATVSIGWVMFYRWVLAVQRGGENLREGIFLFAAGLVSHVVVVGFAAIIAALIVGEYSETLGVLVGWAGGLFLLATLVLNVKAWLIAPELSPPRFPV